MQLHTCLCVQALPLRWAPAALPAGNVACLDSLLSNRLHGPLHAIVYMMPCAHLLVHHDAWVAVLVQAGLVLQGAQGLPGRAVQQPQCLRAAAAQHEMDTSRPQVVCRESSGRSQPPIWGNEPEHTDQVHHNASQPARLLMLTLPSWQ